MAKYDSLYVRNEHNMVILPIDTRRSTTESKKELQDSSL